MYRWKRWAELKASFIKNFDGNVIQRSYIYAGNTKARFIRRISVASDAIQTVDN